MKEDNCGYVIYFVASRPYINKAVDDKIFYIDKDALLFRDELNKKYNDDELFKVYQGIISVNKNPIEHY